MALIVENGTGLATAESYISVADFKAYCDARGYSYADKSDAAIEQALRRATSWVDANYSMKLCGVRVAEHQALILPLSGLVDWQGYYVASNAVPRQLVAATAEAGYRELTTPGSLAPDVTTGKIKKRVRVEGAVEVEYAVGSADAASQTPIVTVIDGIISTLLPRSNPYSGKAVRG